MTTGVDGVRRRVHAYHIGVKDVDDELHLVVRGRAEGNGDGLAAEVKRRHDCAAVDDEALAQARAVAVVESLDVNAARDAGRDGCRSDDLQVEVVVVEA